MGGSSYQRLFDPPSEWGQGSAEKKNSPGDLYFIFILVVQAVV